MKKRGPARPGRILAVDIGGTKLKVLASGETEPRKAKSGPKLTPEKMVEEVKALAKGWRYDAVSIGLPAQVGPNGPVGEPGNLGAGWVGFDYAAAFDCPVRLVNDAAMQALGSYEGGRMLFIGLGTGVGSALIVDHVLIPLELGDLHFEQGSVSDMLGRRAFEREGKKAWRKAVNSLVAPLQKAFLADYVVLGGGNAKRMGKKLPPGVRLGNNLTAFRGGYRLWGIEDVPTMKVNGAAQPTAAAAVNAWRVL
jgi:polyphosphate glucokinase